MNLGFNDQVSRIAGGGSRALSGLFCGKAQHFAGGRGASPRRRTVS